MTQQQYIISRKLNILELGDVLGDISESRLELGVSRQHYSDIKRAMEEEGLEGLLEKSRRVPRVGSRVAPGGVRSILKQVQHKSGFAIVYKPKHWFVSLEEARRIIKLWRMDYNTARPHSSLGYMTPEAFRLSFEQKLENDKINRELSLAVV